MSSDRQDSKEKLPFIVIPMLDPSVRTKGGILIGFQVNSNNSYFINSNFILFWYFFQRDTKTSCFAFGTAEFVD